MSLLRAGSRLQSTLRHSSARATIRAAAPARTQLVARRFASSGGHGDGHGEASSDIPWLLGALVVTPPSCWYLWPDQSHAEHHDDHGAHEEHEEKPEEEPQEEAAPAEKASGEEEKGGDEESSDEKPAEEDKSEDKSDDKPAEDKKDTSDEQEKAKEDPETAKPSGSEGEAQPKNLSTNTPSSGQEEPVPKEQPESRGNVEGANFKGKMKEDSDGQSDTRKSEPDQKGAFKKRIDSGLGKSLGGDSEPDAMFKKSKGWANTDTRHSMQIDAPGSEKSTKGSGGPETAKHPGTVDPSAKLK